MSREDKLRLAIKDSLENVTKANSTNIYRMGFNKKIYLDKEDESVSIKHRD